MNSNPGQPLFKLTKSIRRDRDRDRGDTRPNFDFLKEPHYNLLKDNKSSILGDIRILMGNKEYTLDRAILASKSHYFKDLMLSKTENDIVNEVNDSIMPEDTSIVHDIIDIIYGNKDMEDVMNEENFVKVLNCMQVFKMQIDKNALRDFFDDTMNEPKLYFKFNIQMFELLNFTLKNSPHFNNLLNLAQSYISYNLPDVYVEKKRFLSLSPEGLISILLYQSYCPVSSKQLEQRLVCRMCVEWICHEFQNRVEKLKDLVNAVKYRYGLLPYCHWDLNIKIESLKKEYSSEPDVAVVEKYFNELLFSFGEAKFDIPSELTGILNSMQQRKGHQVESHLVNPTDQTAQWVSFLENEIFSDVAIIVQGTAFKLHRIKLSSVSGYFYDLFTNPAESLAFEVDKSNDELKIRTHVLDQIDPETFRGIVQYIYRQEIEVTSMNHLISLLKASKLFKIFDLFEKCFSRLRDNNYNFSADIVEIFQYVCQNGKFSELYDTVVYDINYLWPKLNENLQFLNISLGTLTEIITLPRLKIDSTDQVVDLCSKWIFHDIQNRYKHTIEVAKAINRNLAMYIDQLELETPLNFNESSQQYVKQQLIRILSSTTLVPAKLKIVLEDGQKPCFLTLDKNHFLCVLSANFNEITRFQVSGVNVQDYFWSSATLIDNQLFVLFRKQNYEFYFQLYDLSSNKMIILASDGRMNFCKQFVILSCNDEVYFCGDKEILKYSVQLNRWVSFLNDGEWNEKLYTSDGEKLYKIFSSYNRATAEWENKASYFDFEQNRWIALPNIPLKTESIMKGRVNIIQGGLSVLLKLTTFSFSWVTQQWTSVSNCCANFVEFTADGQNIFYVSDKNEVHLYSPARNEWTLQKNLDIVGSVRTVHKIDT